MATAYLLTASVWVVGFQNMLDLKTPGISPGAGALADDQLNVNTATGTCTQYFAVELSNNTFPFLAD